MLDNTKVIQQEVSDNRATISIEPLEKGYGHTLGNSLRRVMLNSLPGAAIGRVRIKGAPHQFMTLDGMTEDVVDLLLNLKQVRLRSHTDESVTLKLVVKGDKEVTAADIQTNAQIEVVNPELHLAYLASGGSLDIELVIEKGIGYYTAEERVLLELTEKAKLGEILLDTSFSPVKRVNYTVEATRVGRITNFDRLIIDIFTDGTVAPLDAVKGASQILEGYFSYLKSAELNTEVEQKDDKEKVVTALNESITVDELDLSPKISNRLKDNGYDTVSALLDAGMDELLKLPNFGEKSLREVEEKLQEKGFSFK